MRRLRALVRELGWSDALLHLTARALGSLTKSRMALHKYYFVAQPIPAAPLLPAHRGRSIEVRQVGPDDPLASHFPRPPQVIARRFAAGAWCFAAAKEGRFVGYLWLQPGSYLEDEVACRFTPLPAGQAVWDFDVYVDEAHRRGFAFGRLWDAANAHCRARGVAWSVSRISAFNPGSLVAHAALGASPLGSACYLKAGRLQLMWGDVAPRLHLLRAGGVEPELRLSAEGTPARHYRRFKKT